MHADFGAAALVAALAVAATTAAAAAAAAFSSNDASSALHIPLQKRAVEGYVHRTRTVPHPRRVASVNGVPVDLRNFVNYQYYGVMEIGTPGQAVYMLFDTGSTDMWVVDADAPGRWAKKNTYDNSQSSSYQADNTPFQTTYGSGSVEGYWSIDDVAVASLSAKAEHFAEVNSGDLSSGFVPDGILGMAFPALSQRPSLTPVLRSLLRENNLKNRFSFFLSRTDSDRDSVLSLGGSNTSMYAVEDFTYVPILDNPQYWTVRMPQLSIGDASFCEEDGCFAIIDSGTSLIGVPSNLFNAVLNAIIAGFECEETAAGSEMYLCECFQGADDFPDMHIDFEIERFDRALLSLLPLEYLMIEADGNDHYCLPGIFRIDPGFGNNVFIFGDVFMRVYYTEFDIDEEKVGFARSVVAPARSWTWITTAVIVYWVCSSLGLAVITGIYLWYALKHTPSKRQRMAHRAQSGRPLPYLVGLLPWAS